MFALVCWIWQHDMSRTYMRSKGSASVPLLSKQALRCTKVYSCPTLILQVGMTEQAQYIHRIGRTARAGKQGEAVLLLHDFENFFLSELKGLPVQQMQPASQQASFPCPRLYAALVAVPTYIVQHLLLCLPTLSSTCCCAYLHCAALVAVPASIVQCPSCTAAFSSQNLHTMKLLYHS